MRPGKPWRGGVASLLAVALLTASSAAQQPAPEPADPPPAPGAEPPPDMRLRALELQNQQLRAELADLSRRQDALTRAVTPPPPPREAPLGNTPGQLGRPIPAGLDAVQSPDAPPLPSARVDLSQGVRIFSPDGQYRFEFHSLTQVEGRFFSPAGGQLANNFDIPRQRLVFAGQVGPYFDFVSSTQRGYGTFDLFDAYINFKVSTEFNVRVGRTKTPYSYEYYKTGEGDLLANERSVFIGNLSPNRQIGVMAFGRVWDERVEYAAGLFNGPHRSFQDFNNYKNPFLFVNARPFLYGGSDLLRYLNFGGSANYGRENDPLEPNALRTANDETTAAAVDNLSPAFLRFNPNATEQGETAFWSGDTNWFYRGLTAQAQYNGGFLTYALPRGRRVDATRVPFTGWSATLAYFLTGEETTNRREIVPLRDFDLRNPWAGPGAVEPFARVAYINAGANVFTSGLADGRLYSNDALVFDNGVHWYPNRFVRVTFDWQHASYGSRVQVSGNRFTDSTNLFWLRTQLYY